MVNDIAGQFWVFVLLTCFGVVVGSLYYFFSKFFQSKLSTAIFDCLFGLTVGWLLLTINLHYNNGQIRLYVLLAFCLGIAVGINTLKTMLDKVFVAMYNLCTRLHEAKYESNICKQKKVNNICVGSIADSDTSLHVV